MGRFAALLALFGSSANGAGALGVSPKRLADTLASDAPLLQQLREHGDRADVVRSVSVYFWGKPQAIAKLEPDLARLGWSLVNRLGPTNGQVGLEVARKQSVEPASIQGMSEAALRIEAEYGVDYDGWETSVETR